MTLLIVLIVFLSVLLIIYNNQNKYSYLFGVSFIAIDVIIFTMIIYTARISIYPHLIQLDYMFFSKLLSYVNISFFSMKLILLFSIVAFLLSMFLIFLNYCSDGKKVYIALFTVASFVYINLNSDWLIEYICIYRATHVISQLWYHRIECLIMTYSNLYIIFGCLLPHIKLVSCFRSTRLFFVKNSTIISIVTITAIESIFFILIYSMPLRAILQEIEWYKISTINSFINVNMYNHILLFAYFIIIVNAIVFIKTNLLDEVHFVRPSRTYKKQLAMNDIRYVFHTHKNTILIIIALANKSITNYGTAAGLDSLHKIKENALGLLNALSMLLNFYNTLQLNLDTISLIDCIESAVYKIDDSERQKIEISVSCETATVYGDSFQLTEAIYNILSNSVEAIRDNEDGKIIIDVFQEQKWLCVSVWDNGVGIPFRDRRKVFHPLYSTKKKSNNMGIGLTYAKKVVESHIGFLNFKSKINKHTQFQIIIPFEKE